VTLSGPTRVAYHGEKQEGTIIVLASDNDVSDLKLSVL
jgi:hypothetical protein